MFTLGAISIPVLIFAPLFYLGNGDGEDACFRDSPLLNSYQCLKNYIYQGCGWFEMIYLSLEAKVYIIF